MGQFLFLLLFLVALAAGILSSLHTEEKKGPSSMRIALDTIGFTPTQDRNKKSSKQATLLVRNGLIQIREQMQNISQQQNALLALIEERQQILENFGKDAKSVMDKANQSGQLKQADVLRIKELMDTFGDKERLLVEQGRDLVEQNEQLGRTREAMEGQLDYIKVRNEATLQMLNQRNEALQNQAKVLMDQSLQHNKMVRETMDQMKDKLNDVVVNAKQDATAEQRDINERIKLMLEKQQDNVAKLESKEERARNSIRDMQENLYASKQRFNDVVDRSRDLSADSRQRSEDQSQLVRQRTADQMQMLRDRTSK